MYIQLTTRCNMLCQHCGFACTAKGKDMSLDTFKKAFDLAMQCSDHVSIGGGEPTLNPHFWDMLAYAIVHYDYSKLEYKVWLATNGKKTKDALKLAELAKNGIIACELSQDDYHEEIDEKVVKAFQKSSFSTSDNNDYRGVRNTTKYREPIKSGRATWGQEQCICNSIFIHPNGDISQCGCLDAPIIGHVSTGLPQGIEMNTCWKYH